jgi:nucleoid-associated protein YgaU
MGTMSAAEAKLDAAIRPEITVLRARSSYPVRHRPAGTGRTAGGDDGGDGKPLHVVFAAGAFAARAAGQATADGRARVSAEAAGPTAAGSSPGDHKAAPSRRGAGAAERPSAPGKSATGQPAPAKARVRAAGLRSAGPPSAPKRAPIRLTRRGRIVVAVLMVIVALAVSGMMWLIVAGQAQASNHTRPGGPAGQGMERVIVRPGQTLWGIAVQAEPTADPRVVVQEIIDANSLSGPAIQAGAVLWVPRG